MSARDWRFHAIDEPVHHPADGEYRTACGQALIVTVLYASPGGLIFDDCAASQLTDRETPPR